MIASLYTRYNTLLSEHSYGPKYDFGDARMFVITGMDKVRKVIEENRKRKLTKHKKLPNNTVIEIDNCSPLEIARIQKNLLEIAAGEGIPFVDGKGKRPEQLFQDRSGSYLYADERRPYDEWPVKARI